jgi:hypothetical protein
MINLFSVKYTIYFINLISNLSTKSNYKTHGIKVFRQENPAVCIC